MSKNGHLFSREDKNPSPILTVVVPMKDEAPSVDPFFSALLPILAHDVESFEIVVVNDGSTDDTLRFLRFHRNFVFQG